MLMLEIYFLGFYKSFILITTKGIMMQELLSELDNRISNSEEIIDLFTKNILESNQNIKSVLDKLLKKESSHAKKQQIIEEYLQSIPEELSTIPKSLVYFFAERGLLLQKCTSCNSAKDAPTSKYKLSKKIWDHYELLFPLCKEYCKKENKFDYPLGTLNNDERNTIRTFCENLKKGKALDYVIDEDNILHITKCETKQWLPFLNGGWGEASLLYLLRSALHEGNQDKTSENPHRKFQFFTNLKFSNPEEINKTYMELDVALLVNKTELFIFESKTGNALAVDKWVDRTRLFEINPPDFPLNREKNNILQVKGHFITCCPNEAIKPSYFFPFHLMCFSCVKDEFLKLLAKTEKQDK